MITSTISQKRNGKMSFKNGTMDELKAYYRTLIATYRTRRDLDLRKVRTAHQLVKILNEAADMYGMYNNTFSVA